MEPPISKFQTKKLRSWRSGYARIFSLHSTYFITVDPENFSETNRYPYASLSRATPLNDTSDEFQLELAKEKLKFKCGHRAALLTELLRLKHNAESQSNPNYRPHGTVHPVSRVQRTGAKVSASLQVLPHALVEYAGDGHTVLQEYKYIDMTQVGFTTDDPTGLIIHTTGRGRLFLTQSRSDLASAIKSASEDVSAPFTVGPGQLLSTWTETRAKLGAEAGEPMGTFPVTKPSCRHPLSPSLRSLVLTQQFLLEVDQITGTTVSSRSLSSVYAIVRVASSPNDITIEYKDGQHRTYQSASREDLACSILDATLCIGNSDVSITECVSDGYRLLPRGVREQVDKKGGLLEAFFGSDTIEAWHLKNLAKTSKARLESSNPRDCVDVFTAGLEFNANVPPEGISPATDKKSVAAALTPVISMLGHLCQIKADSSGVPNGVTPAQQQMAESGASTLLQAVFRICKCVHGFQLFLETPHVLEVMAGLLKARDQFTIYWAVKVLHCMVSCPFSPRNKEQEFVNKQVLLAPPAISETLVSLLVGGGAQTGWGKGIIEEAPRPPTPPPAPIVEIQQFDEHGIPIPLKSQQVQFDQHGNMMPKFDAQGNPIPDPSAPPPAPLAPPTPPPSPPPQNWQQPAPDAIAPSAAPTALSTLLLMAVSELLESVLCSSHDTTAPERFEMLTNSISEGYGSLMEMLRSPCALVVENAALLIQMIASHKPKVSALIRDAALSSATLLRHLYNAIFSPSSSQRFLSRYLVTLWMSGPSHCPEKQLLARALPSGFLPYLNMPPLSNLELENLDEMEAGGIEATNTFARVNSTTSSSPTLSAESGTNVSRLRNRIQVANEKNATSASPIKLENFRILFHVITQDHALPDLLWNQQTRRELRISLESELASIERESEIRGGGGRVAWNHQQYRVTYPSLVDEVRVGNVYMRLWLEAGDSFIRTWEEPVRLFELLFRRLLCDMDRDMKITNMCIRCLERLYGHHINTIGNFDDVMILVRSMALTHSVETQHRFLSLLAVLLGVTKDEELNAKVGVNSGNAEQLLNEESITQLCQYVAWSHVNGAQIGNMLGRASITTDNMLEDGSGVGPEGYKSTSEATDATNEKRKAADSSCPKVWFVAPAGSIPPPSNKVRGPFRISELKTFMSNGDLHARSLVTAAHVEDYGESDGGSADATDSSIDTGKWKQIEDVWQLRWQLCTTGEGVYNPSEIGLIALRALTRLVDMHRSVDFRGVPYHPIPIAKKLLCGLNTNEKSGNGKDSLFVIAQAMLCNDSKVVESAATLLYKLCMHNDEACAKLYLTGVFLFAVGYTGSNYHAISALLNETHLKQNFRSGFAAAAEESELPAKERSILGNLLPEGLMFMLLNYGSERFTEVFVGDFNTPEVIWNFKMRQHLVEMVNQHLGDFPKRIWQNTCSQYEYCPVPGIAYKQLEGEIFCHNYYLRNLCDEACFPDWPIAEPVEVLRACLEEWKKEMNRDVVQEEDACEDARKVLSLKGGDGSEELRKSYRSLARKYHPDKNPAGREMFEKIKEAYELLLPVVEKGGKIVAGQDDDDAPAANGEDDAETSVGLVGGGTGLGAIDLLMKTQVILCKRHGDEIGAYKYPAYRMLIGVLQIPKGKEGCLLKPRRAEFVRTGVELVYQTCLVSPLNAEELTSEGAIVVLEELLDYYIQAIKAGEKEGEASRAAKLEIITHIVHTLSGVCWYEAGREAILNLEDPTRLCENWRRCLDGVYWGDTPLVKKYALEGCANMARNAALQTLLVGSGVVWSLVRCLLLYDPTLEGVNVENDEQINQQMSQAASNTHAILACRALGMLSGVMRDDLVTPDNAEMRTAMQKLLTKPLAKLLRNKRAGDLLRALNTNVETPTRIWNVAMRGEILKFLDKMEEGRDERGCRTQGEELKECDSFKFSNLQNEVVVGGVYVRVFNGLGGGREGCKDIDDCGAFCKSLLLFVQRSLHNSASLGEDIEEAKIGGDDEDDKDLWHKVSDRRFTMGVTALRLLVLVEGLVDDVLCDSQCHGPATLLTMLELPQDIEAFDLSSDILMLMAPKQPFADACCSELWRLLAVLESKEESGGDDGGGDTQTREEGEAASASAKKIAKRQIQGWRVLEALTSTPSVALSLTSTTGWLELLGIAVGYSKFSKAFASRDGAVKSLGRLLWDPKTGGVAAPLIGRFLPPTLVAILKESTSTYLSTFDGEAETPELIWDSEMRGELRTQIGAHLDAVFMAREDDTEDGKGGAQWTIDPGFSVKYAKLLDELFIGGVYVRLFLKEPTFNLRNPGGFLELLLVRWSQEMETLTKGRGNAANVNVADGGDAGGMAGALTTAKQDVLNLVTSAAVYLCKVRSPLCDKLAQWGYMAKAVSFGKSSLEKGMVGTTLVSAIRVLHVAAPRRVNVEALALCAPDFLSLIQDASLSGEVGSTGKKTLHQDSAFFVEVLKKVFTDALGDVEHPSAVMAASAAPPAAQQHEQGGAVGTIDARTALDDNAVAANKVTTTSGAPGCAHGRVALLTAAQERGMCTFLLDGVLENPSLGSIMDPASGKVHAVDLLKLLCKDPGFGMQFGLVLDGCPAWSKFKSQNMSLYITGSTQKADYFLTDGGAKDRKLLTSGEAGGGGGGGGAAEEGGEGGGGGGGGLFD